MSAAATTTSHGFAQEELARVAANVQAREALLAERRPIVDAWLAMYTAGTDVLLPLGSAQKWPVQRDWQKTVETDIAGVTAFLHGSGNVGLHLGASRRVGCDGDNAKATEAALAAGWHLHTVSAGSRNPANDHAGGAHTLWHLHDWVPHVRLTGPNVAVEVANGGKFDVLAGNHQLVLPPSVVVTSEAGEPFHVGSYLPASAAGYCASDRDGWALEGAGHKLLLPLWMYSDEILAFAPEGTVIGTPPPGMEALAGTVGIWHAATPRAYDDDDELTALVDAWPFLEMLAEAGVEGEVVGYDRCGPCAMWLRTGSSSAKSITKHDCDEHGGRVQVWTTAFPNCPAGGYSAIDAYVLLTGGNIESDRGRVLAEQGLITPKSLNFADALDEAADKFDEQAEAETIATVLQLFPAEPRQKLNKRGGVSRVTEPMAPVQADRNYWERESAACSALARHLRGGKPTMQQAGGETFVSEPMVGAEVSPPAQPADPAEPIDAEIVEEETAAPTSTAPAVDDAIEGEFVEDDDEWVIRGADAIKRIKELEDKLKGERDPHTKLWRGMTPGLGRIASLAESRGVFPSGLTGALMPRVAARIPSNVIIEPEHGVCENKVEGVGFSHSALLLGPSATGKTKTEITAAAAIPMLPGVAEIPSGTAEGIVKEARSWESTGKGRGKVEVHATAVFVQADEIGTVNAELQRDASKYASFICSATMGNTIVGQTTSDKARKAAWPPHSTRLAQAIGAQPHKCGRLLDDAGSGAGARFDWVPVGSVDPAERGPLYGTPVPPVLVNGRLPWDPPTGIPFGFRPYSGPAATTDDGEDETPAYEIEPMENLPAEWVHFPEGVLDSAGSAQMAADRSANWREAIRTDRALGRVAAHDTLMVMKQATFLAALDGLKQPEKIHWQAALILAEIRAITVAETKVIADDEGDEESRKKGRGRGIEYSTGNAVSKHETQSAIERAAAAIYKKLTAPVEGDGDGKNCGFGGVARRGQLGGGNLTGSLRPFRDDGIALLMARGKVDVYGTGGNTDTIQVRTAIESPVKPAPAPPISNVA